MDLKTLEYPRHLHKNNGHKDNIHGDFLVVASYREAEAAIEEGWSLEACPPNYDEPPVEVVAVAEPVAVPVPEKKARAKKKEA